MKYYLTLVVAVFMSAVGTTSIGAIEESLAETQSRAQVLKPLLNSERIKHTFGSYAINVLKNQRQVRVSNLYSTNNGKDITRTLAVVKYPDNVEPLLSREHKAIVGGQSLGAVFKRNGWKIEKKHLYFGSIESSKKYAGVYSLMGNIQPVDLSIHIYEFYVSKKGERFRYATISEVHHPVYLNSTGLKEIYQETFDQHKTNNTLIQAMLNHVSVQMEQI